MLFCAGCSVLGKAATVGGKQSTGGCNSLQINPSRGEFRQRVVSLSISTMWVDGASGAWDRTWSPGKMEKFLLGNKRIALGGFGAEGRKKSALVAGV